MPGAHADGAWRCAIADTSVAAAKSDTVHFECVDGLRVSCIVLVDNLAFHDGITLEIAMRSAGKEKVSLGLDSAGIVYPSGDFRQFEGIQVDFSYDSIQPSVKVKPDSKVALHRWLGWDTTASGYLYAEWSQEQPLRVLTPKISDANGTRKCESRVILVYPPLRRGVP